MQLAGPLAERKITIGLKIWTPSIVKRENCMKSFSVTLLACIPGLLALCIRPQLQK